MIDNLMAYERLEKKIATSTPLYTVLILFVGWWTFILFWQSFAENPLPTWTTLVKYHDEIYWQVIWYSLLAAHFIGYIFPGFWLRKMTVVAESIVWLYTGYILTRGALSVTLGQCFILSFLSLVCLVKMIINAKKEEIERQEKIIKWKHQVEKVEL